MAIRHEMGYSVVLCYMGGLFAAVWYSPEYNQIALVHRFKWRESLGPFLWLVEMEELME